MRVLGSSPPLTLGLPAFVLPARARAGRAAVELPLRLILRLDALIHAADATTPPGRVRDIRAFRAQSEIAGERADRRVRTCSGSEP
jgi:hypothetical protein